MTLPNGPPRHWAIAKADEVASSNSVKLYAGYNENLDVSKKERGLPVDTGTVHWSTKYFTKKGEKKAQHIAPS